MHTVYFARDEENDHGFPDSALGILFSVNDYTAKLNWMEQRIIDDFFDSLDWTTTDVDPTVSKIPFGDLLKVVNWNHRWVY